MSEFEKELVRNMKSGKIPWESDPTSYYMVSKPALELIFGDWQPPKQLVVVPKFVDEYIESCRKAEFGLIWSIRPDRDANELSRLTYDWLFPNGVRLEHGEFPQPFEPDNLVTPDRPNQVIFTRAWIDGYTVEKEKLYLLKHIDVSSRDTTINCYLTHTFTPPFIGHTSFSKGYDMSAVKECHFTQQEIDDMATGSYKQIEVTE